jgi:hypothetical protein
MKSSIVTVICCCLNYFVKNVKNAWPCRAILFERERQERNQLFSVLLSITTVGASVTLFTCCRVIGSVVVVAGRPFFFLSLSPLLAFCFSPPINSLEL